MPLTPFAPEPSGPQSVSSGRWGSTMDPGAEARLEAGREARRQGMLRDIAATAWGAALIAACEAARARLWAPRLPGSDWWLAVEPGRPRLPGGDAAASGGPRALFQALGRAPHPATPKDWPERLRAPRADPRRPMATGRGWRSRESGRRQWPGVRGPGGGWT